MKIMKIQMFLAVAVMLLAGTARGLACRVDTLSVWSAVMQRGIGVSVIVPDNAVDGRQVPAVYLLPGYGDNHLRGYLGLTNVRTLADCLGVLVVVPDPKNSWYFDSPVDSTLRYETFVACELVAYVDSCYPTVADRAHRAVTGLSMGGHGALYLGLRHQDVWGAVGSMSGGVDFRGFPDKWCLKDCLGPIDKGRELWDRNTVMAQLPLLKDGSLCLIIDCGTEDFFYNVNEALHARLRELGIRHEYTTRPGRHDWEYWKRSLRDHLLFFHDYFRANDLTK